MSHPKMENTHQMIPRDSLNLIATDASITAITNQSRNILSVGYAEQGHAGVKVTFKPSKPLKMVNGLCANPMSAMNINTANQLANAIGVEVAADGSAIWINTGSSLTSFSLTIFDPISTDCGVFPIP
jgi:hypothetical protein